MIEKFFMDELKTMYPDYKVSETWQQADDKMISVMLENGTPPDPDNETGLFEPYYMIWIQSTHWADVSKMAYEIFKRFKDVRHETIANYDDIQFKLYQVVASTPPNRIGVQDGFLQYSVNFRATIKEV